jgi:rifampicin phosphotransferase
VGSEPYQGTARFVTGSGQGLADFEPGEVLVATMTSPSYNVVLSLAGAVVTETGDAMSHAAIMARELRFPAVIGVQRSAVAAIRDGDLVTVDPRAGSVTVHPPAASPPPRQRERFPARRRQTERRSAPPSCAAAPCSPRRQRRTGLVAD